VGRSTKEEEEDKNVDPYQVHVLKLPQDLDAEQDVGRNEGEDRLGRRLRRRLLEVDDGVVRVLEACRRTRF
jgi:hypothetical protein